MFDESLFNTMLAIVPSIRYRESLAAMDIWLREHRHMWAGLELQGPEFDAKLRELMSSSTEETDLQLLAVLWEVEEQRSPALGPSIRKRIANSKRLKLSGEFMRNIENDLVMTDVGMRDAAGTIIW